MIERERGSARGARENEGKGEREKEEGERGKK